MKKLLTIALALIVASALVVSCGGGKDDPPPKKAQTVKITFDGNVPSDASDFTLAGVPSVQTINKGKSLGAKYPSTNPTLTKEGGTITYLFQGWFLNKTGGNAITPATTFSAATTVYAQWEKFDSDAEWLVTWNWNYTNAPAPTSHGVDKTDGHITAPATSPTRDGYIFEGWGTSATATETVTFPIAAETLTANVTYYAVWLAQGASISIRFRLNYVGEDGEEVPMLAAPTTSNPKAGTALVAADFPANPTRATEADEYTWKFEGWYTSRWTGHGDEVKAGSILTGNTTVYAQWSHVWSNDIKEQMADTAVRVYLENSGHAIFTVSLDSGYKWGDIENIKVQYIVDEDQYADMHGAQIRTRRVMGNYVDGEEGADFSPRGNKQLAVFDGKNGDYILDGGQQVAWSTDWSAVGITGAYQPGITTYSALNAASHVPGATAEGPFLLGFGISGSGNSGTSGVGAPSLHHGFTMWIGYVQVWGQVPDPDGAEDATKDGIIGTGVLKENYFAGYGDGGCFQWSSTDPWAEPVVTFCEGYAEDPYDNQIVYATEDLDIDVSSPELFGNDSKDGMSVEFDTDGVTILVDITAPAQGGADDGGNWGRSVTFKFPENTLPETYEAIVVEYTATVDASTNTADNNPQFTVKKGYKSFSGIGASNGEYQTISTGDNEFEVKAELFPGADGISFQPNSWAAGNLPMKLSIKFTKITLVAP